MLPYSFAFLYKKYKHIHIHIPVCNYIHYNIFQRALSFICCCLSSDNNNNTHIKANSYHESKYIHHNIYTGIYIYHSFYLIMITNFTTYIPVYIHNRSTLQVTIAPRVRSYSLHQSTNNLSMPQAKKAHCINRHRTIKIQSNSNKKLNTSANKVFFLKS